MGLAAISTVEAEKVVVGRPVSQFSDLLWDENGHLGENYLLISDNDDCEEILENAWLRRPDYKHRTVMRMRDEVHDLFPVLREDNLPSGSYRCNAVCLDRGTPKDHIVDADKRKSHESLVPFMDNTAMRVEFGFLNWTPNQCGIYWVDQLSNRRVFSGNLLRKEKNTLWQTTTLGHVFEIEDSVTKEIVGRYEAKYPAINVIGRPVGDEGVHPIPDKRVGYHIKQTFNNEWQRANRVKRTFTELGFAKGKLPVDLFTSIRTYYYNNQNQLAREEWEDKGLFVNWYEVEAFMIGMPWNLKSYWQQRLKPLVEAWSGVDLQLTDIYGMRRYEDGARLLTHVDREETHAASLIVNVAQHGMRKPWMLEIYDFAGRLHEVEMDEGDIVYYESARCLHGRMAPLQGSAYVNLFAHYRPIDNPKWYLEENPEGTPEQCLDVESASEPIRELYNEHVSSSGQQLTGPETLWQYWLDMGDEAESTHGFKPNSAYLSDDL
eukprot:GSChrysophyteH1.ASY1.ANO1.33.1 assembled CDS